MAPTIYTPTDRISQYYAQRAKEILARFTAIRELMTHEGAKGARVQKEVRNFLLEFLPERYQYASGIVIDCSGREHNFSRQEDVLIVDRFFNAKLIVDEEPSVYPVDVVYCGIEVKTCIDEKELRSAVANIASLKSLKFIQEPVAYAIGAGLRVIETTEPIGIIFAFDTDVRKAETLLKHLHEAVKDYPRPVWPNLVCVLNRGIMGFATGNKPFFSLYGLLGQGTSGSLAEVIATQPGSEFEYGGQRYPAVDMNGKNYVVDVGRTFTGFLGELYEFLLSKVLIAQSNLLHRYVPEAMRRRKCLLHEDTGPAAADPGAGGPKDG
jgi:hypothetical protein